MKKLFTVMVLLPLFSRAQNVDSRQNITVAKTQNIELSCMVTNAADTSYVLSFRDNSYKLLEKYATVPMSRKQVGDFAIALYRLGKDEYKAKESTVTLDKLLLSKESLMGGEYIALSYNGALGWFINLKKSTGFAKDIAAFLTGKQAQ
jgi:hypothetical protein